MFKKSNKKPRVIVAMSGGVDSSVTAALLKKQGYEIIGMTLQLFCYAKTSLQKKSCCSLESIRDAREICIKLGARHYVIDAQKKFNNKIINNFILEYQKGHTPNPCVRCNELIKFNILLKKARELGVEYVATGHYAKIINDQLSMINLCRARDKNKDQSYFLYGLGQAELKYLLFPLGKYTKKEVRGLAKKFGLKVASKPESQEICFIDTTYQKFLVERLGDKLKRGEIIDLDGNKIGEHSGLPFYTIGQRAGIGGRGPYYVVKTDLKRGSLIVTNKKDDPALLAQKLIAKNVNWISGEEPKMPFKAMIQVRYRQKEVSAVVKKMAKKGQYKVKFAQPQRAITAGQSVVFYDKNKVLGGGVIQ